MYVRTVNNSDSSTLVNDSISVIVINSIGDYITFLFESSASVSDYVISLKGNITLVSITSINSECDYTTFLEESSISVSDYVTSSLRAVCFN
jgi:hypothetical protein